HQPHPPPVRDVQAKVGHHLIPCALVTLRVDVLRRRRDHHRPVTVDLVTRLPPLRRRHRLRRGRLVRRRVPPTERLQRGEVVLDTHSGHRHPLGLTPRRLCRLIVNGAI